MPLGVLVGEAKVYKHGKAKTLYVTIPSHVAQDSAFTIKDGDSVKVEFDTKLDAIVIRRLDKKTTKPEH